MKNSKIVIGALGVMLTASLFAQGTSAKLGGYLDAEYKSSNTDNRFYGHRFILAPEAQIHDRISFAAEIELEYGAFVKGSTTSNTKSGEIKIEQAWIDYKFSDAFVQRTGIVVVPFGRLNVYHDSDLRDATNRPAFAKKIVPTTWMDSGFGFHGVVDFDDVEINYQSYLINGLNSDEGAISASNGIRSARPNLKTDNNQNKALVARLGISPAVGLEFGSSYYSGKHDALSEDCITMLGVDALYKTGALELVGEYAQNKVDDSTNTAPTKMNGFYLESRYHLSGDWLKNSAFGDGFDNPVITLFARYGQVDTDTAVTDVNDVTQTTIGFNFRPTESFVYKFEYEFNSSEVNDTDDDAFYASVALGF